MKSFTFTMISMMIGHSVMAMPCDTGWLCKSKSGKYALEVQRCRYTNSIGNLQSLKVHGTDVAGAKITAAYDSKSIGGKILAIEVSIPDTTNDAHYLSFETVASAGKITERIQPSNPGPQSVVASESISCKETE